MRERILKALTTSDMKDEEHETHAHVVASLGAAQIGRKHLSLGALLLHIRAGQARFLPTVLGLITIQVQRRAAKERWTGVTPLRAAGLARIALDRHLNANCGACNGVGQLGDLGQVIVLCQTCKGSGKRRDEFKEMADELGMTLQKFRDGDFQDKVKAVIGMLERLEGYASAGTRQKARGSNI
jgi:hypothetical protein